MTTAFDGPRDFDYANAILQLWVFKRSSSARKFNAVYVPIDSSLETSLRDVARSEVIRVSEVSEYTHLAEVNEVSCLVADDESNEFHQYLKIQVDRPAPECILKSIKDLKGADGYVVKFSHGDSVVYAVKRSTSNWKTAYPKNFINMIFRDGQLSAAESNGFSIERNFDFLVFKQFVFVLNKRAFESSMQFRAAFAQAFADLHSSAAFSGLFTDVAPLLVYVGTNTMQLRRMAAISEKALYLHPQFLTNIVSVNLARKWGLNFEPKTNRLIVCDKTVRTIIQILLDHRLLSEVTQNIYDVPDATQV